MSNVGNSTRSARTKSVSLARRIAFVVLSVLFGAAVCLLIVGSVQRAFSPDGRGQHVMLLVHAGWLALLAIGFLAPLRSGERKPAAWQQVAALTAVLLVGGLAAGLPRDPVFEIGFPVAVILTGVLHPARRQFFRSEHGPSALLAVLAVLAFVPFTMVALDHLATAAAAGDQARALAYAAVALAALSVPVLALVASMRSSGWRLCAWSAGLVPLVWGIASLAYPGEPSAFGIPAAVGMLAGVGVFLSATEWEARRARHRPVIPTTSSPSAA